VARRWVVNGFGAGGVSGDLAERRRIHGFVSQKTEESGMIASGGRDKWESCPKHGGARAVAGTFPGEVGDEAHIGHVITVRCFAENARGIVYHVLDRCGLSGAVIGRLVESFDFVNDTDWSDNWSRSKGR
jgi:hypothetical protein